MSPRTSARHMLYMLRLVMRPQLSLGALDVLWHVCRVEAPTVPAKPPLETCAVVAACSAQPRPGGAGTAVSMSQRSAMLLSQPSPRAACLHLSWHVDTASARSTNCLS